ncbi:MAG TPA: twin-arginine translocase TatA/TatE family subunit, partial [Phycisphaerae bacterium]|nr:twin-arginine translocase TatA/TatE family subunit [Phycisphaerae bacterium]
MNPPGGASEDFGSPGPTSPDRQLQAGQPSRPTHILRPDGPDLAQPGDREATTPDRHPEPRPACTLVETPGIIPRAIGPTYPGLRNTPVRHLPATGAFVCRLGPMVEYPTPGRPTYAARHRREGLTSRKELSMGPTDGFVAFISMPGGGEMIILGIIGLLIFGNRLPEVAKSLGKSVVEFKRGLSGVQDEIERSINTSQQT